ncbi:hypothetical protein RI129_012965 [Pyrocoelia pectoralis]|uniref:Protein Malvolio n=1 Tax=Pyrocoelia pectoralis TaxID=417401 RepID=A0AAN7UV30_9COLE
MPHNLYLHSALVKSRDIDRRRPEKIREANLYFFVEAAIAIFVSFIINLFVVAVFAHGLYKKTNHDIIETCQRYPSLNASTIFPDNNKFVDADIYKGGIFLGCTFGIAALYIWAIGILASGQSSTMTGTYAGQFAMEGFLNLQWVRWKRVLLTRSIAIVPTFCVAFFSTIENLTSFNDILNAVMSVQLPFALIPTIAFTSNVEIMGEFVNGIGNIIMAILTSAGIIGINTYFVISTIIGAHMSWYYLVLVSLVGIVYMMFCIYLGVHMVIFMGAKNLMNYSFINKYVWGPSIDAQGMPWTLLRS